MKINKDIQILGCAMAYYGGYEPNYSAQNGSTLLWNMSTCVLEYMVKKWASEWLLAWELKSRED